MGGMVGEYAEGGSGEIAALVWSAGAYAPGTSTLLTCTQYTEQAKAAPALSRNRKRVIIGKADDKYGGDDVTTGARSQAKLVAGFDCGDDSACISSPHGAGYYIPNDLKHDVKDYWTPGRGFMAKWGDGRSLDWLGDAARGQDSPAAPNAPYSAFLMAIPFLVTVSIWVRPF